MVFSMIKSMSGYGRGTWIDENMTITVEARSGNSRYLEIIIRSPKEISLYEDEIKRLIQKHIRRGRVECSITIENNNATTSQSVVNWERVTEYANAITLIQQKLGLTGPVHIDTILSLPDVFNTTLLMPTDINPTHLMNAVSAAVESLASMRNNEGILLKKDTIDKINSIVSKLHEIGEHAPLVEVEHYDRLVSKVQNFLHGTFSVDEGRLFNELALYAEKSSIDEEIVRLQSHCKQFLSFIELQEPMGRSLDFLLQEMNREINTIGAKANCLAITQIVIAIKSEIEKLREQVQNIE